jgi:uncharacterized protein YqeY
VAVRYARLVNLTDKISVDLVAALKAHEELRLSTLRMVKAALKNREIEKRAPLSDDDAMQVLGTLIKQREDAAAQFDAGGRPELARKERDEIVIIDDYLPRPLSPEEIETAVRAAMQETGAGSPKDMGRVMKAVMARLKGQRAEGKTVSATVRRLLGG